MLSRTDTVRALRDMIGAGVLWSIYNQIIPVASPIFTGYALEIGVSRGDIGTLTSLAFLMCLSQPVGFVLSNWFRNKKRFVIGLGLGETIALPLCALAPLLAPRAHALVGLLPFLVVGMFCSNAAVPRLSAWWANVIPAEIRGRYQAKRFIIMAIAGAVFLQAAGIGLDRFPSSRLVAFQVLLGLALVTGCGGYIWLARMPYPGAERQEPRPFLLKLRLAARNRTLRRCVACFGLIQGAYFVALPFFNVFMIERMGLPYWKIAVITNLALASTILSYRLCGLIIDRLGSAVVVQLLIGPMALGVWLWTLVRGDNAWLAGTAMVLGTFSFSGIFIAAMTLFYGIAPRGERQPVFMSVWLIGINTITALGAFLGGRLLAVLPETIHLGSVHFDAYQGVFAASGALLLVGFPLSRRLPACGDVALSLWTLLRRGNVLSYAYHYLWFSIARDERSRAQRLRKMARSGSPAAVGPLLCAMEAASPDMRSEAALGLGEVKDDRAVDRLIETASDSGSDVREAALAGLGKSGHPAALDILTASLDDPETSVRNSAIHALAQIGGAGALCALRRKLAGPFDPKSFPTLVDGLAALGDLDIVETAITALDRFENAAIRLRILQAAARAVGAERTLARLLAADPLRRTEIEMRILERLQGQLKRAKRLAPDIREVSVEALAWLGRFFESEDVTLLESGALAQSARVLSMEKALAKRFGYPARVLVVSAHAVRAYMQLDSRHAHPVEQTAVLETLSIRQVRYLLGLREAE